MWSLLFWWWWYTKQSPWSFTIWYLTSWKSAPSVSPYHTCPVAFWSLSAFEQLQGPHHQRHIRYLSGVRSGTILRRTSVQLSKPSDATHSARFVGQPGRGRRLPQPGQLTIRVESAGLSQQQLHGRPSGLNPHSLACGALIVVWPLNNQTHSAWPNLPLFKNLYDTIICRIC